MQLTSNNSRLWVSQQLDLGDDPFQAVRNLSGEVVRQAPGRLTLRFERAGQGYFLKRHEGVGWLEILKNLLSLRLPVLGAENEWQAIQCLQSCGVPTMRAVAYGVRGGNPARRESFIITEELAPTESLEDFTAHWRERPPRVSLKRQLLSEVARMTRTMHGAGMNHRDLYLCHFLLHTDLLQQGIVKLSLIDLHRAQLRKSVPRRWRYKDLASLYFSAFTAGLTERDLLRFAKLYFGSPLRDILRYEKRDLCWLRKERGRLQRKYIRKYAPGKRLP